MITFGASSVKKKPEYTSDLADIYAHENSWMTPFFFQAPIRDIESGNILNSVVFVIS
ncbi:hypothetical protein BB560_000266 [Smittium megazygosporum]|uniref:Uncharacterized protein n=1 Tax=Smittium megazygosporum TaxID=133381 RepID=A0A2T9ZKY4_9FUNG|nr:hypothetical protein BB560_000266 [Smittium megazygosporum]